MTELLRLEDVSFTVSDQPILDGISLTIESNERTSLSGASGSGKSTLLKAMAAIIPLTEGKIYFEGQDIRGIDYTDYRKQVSYVYQNPQLFGETVKDNLNFPFAIRGQEFDLALAEAYLEDVGLEYIGLSKDINSLSGGEKQRLSLIRHFIYPPKILLLDEITASLDEESSEKIWQWIFDQADEHQISLVWISHKPHEQEMAERQIIISQGQVKAPMEVG